MNERAARRGFVLVLSLLAVVVVGALIIATHVAVGHEHHVAATAIERQRAFATSEHGLWQTIADWDAANFALPRGGVLTKTVRVLRDSATVTTVRLNDRLYWVVSEAIVGEARRTTGANVRAVRDSTGVRVMPVRRSWVEVH